MVPFFGFYPCTHTKKKMGQTIYDVPDAEKKNLEGSFLIPGYSFGWEGRGLGKILRIWVMSPV